MVLKDYIEIKKGKKEIIVDYTEDSVRYIQIADLRNDDFKKYCVPREKSIFANKDDVVIAWDGANACTVGYGIEGVIGSTLAVLKIKNKKFLPEYLGEFLRGNQKYLRSKCTGATIPHINRSSLENLKINSISIEKQKEIVSKISNAYRVRMKREQTLRLLDEFAKSSFISMFGDPHKNPKGWQNVSPPDIASKEKYSVGIGPFGSNLLRSDYKDDGVPLVFVKNIREKWFFGEGLKFVTPEKASELKAHQAKSRDVLMTKMGDPPGDPAVYPEGLPDVVITADCIKLTVDETIADPYFICSMFDTKYVRGQVEGAARGVAQKKINLSLFKSLKFPLPPLNEQVKYVKLLSEINNLKGKVESSENECALLIKSLALKYFSANI